VFHRLFDNPIQFLLPGLVLGVGVLLFLSYWDRVGHPRTARVVALVLLMAWIGFVVFADLIGPTNLAPGLPRPHFSLVPLKSFLDGRRAQEVVGNLALFVPLGALLPFAVPRLTALWRVCAIAFLLSLGLEVAQWTMNVGRLSDIDDAVLNAAGALVGWVSWRLASYRARPEIRSH
jgi:glycopeptide antibiotics resistance protein